MKKFYKCFTVCFLIYAIFILIYFNMVPSTVPEAYRGGPADPATFMSNELLKQVHSYSMVSDLTYFLIVPLDWLLLFSIVGWSVRLRNFVEHRTNVFLLQILMYSFVFNLFQLVVHIPLSITYFILDHQYGLSSETIATWLWDMIKNFAIDLIFSVPLVWLAYKIVHKSPRRWWIWSWFLFTPIIVFIFFIKPVMIDPLFNTFIPLQNQELKHDILTLAGEVKIPTNEVYEVNMSQKTNVMNAYVTGIGTTTRIVIWDNTIRKLKEDEILFVMAHEMGHYLEKHILWGLGISLISLFLLLWVLHRIFEYILSRWGAYWGLRGIADLAAVPLLYLVYSLINFSITPVENMVSRVFEHRADMFAMKLYGNVDDAGVRAFQKLAADSLEEVNPPTIVQVFLGDHPTLMERIDFVHHYNSTGK